MRRKLAALFSLAPLLIALPMFAQSTATTENPSFRVVLDPNQQTKLSAEIRSPVKKITKKMGDSFKKGEVLIQLEDAVFQADLQESEAVLEQAEVELEGKKQLFNDKVLSLFDLKKAESDLAAAKAKLALSKKNVAATQVIAPYNGKVVDFMIHEHELTEVGREMTEIVEDKTLVAKMLIPTSELQTLKIGQPITITLDESGDTIDTTVTRIGAIIDAGSSTIPVESDIDNSEGKYIAGSRGKAVFQ